MRPWFVRRQNEALEQLARATADCPETAVIIGIAVPNDGPVGKPLFNSAALVHGGQVTAIHHKSLLPTYDVFDEDRYFSPAASVHVTPFGTESLGILICEDAWNDPRLWPDRRPYACDPVAELARCGATLFINISASPFHAGKDAIRAGLISRHARAHGCPFLYLNQVGGNDELIFDGHSLCFDGRGLPTAVLSPFVEEVRTVDTTATGDPHLFVPQDEVAAIHDALVLGIRDYMRKCGFGEAVVGLSGGIDSAVTCALAVTALGPGNVRGITMPSAYSSPGSVDDSVQLAANLGIRCDILPISDLVDGFKQTLKPLFAGTEEGTAEENIQSRIRGNLLMAVSNKFGSLVLTTGNKSELAMGYCTLYGDMSGGLAVLSDVPKMMVYRLAEYINREGHVIPRASIEKAPSAELRPGQTDQDTLPPYPVLDEIIRLHVEEHASPEEIAAQGFDAEMVRRTVGTIDRNEYKRRQAAPGLKVTTRAFGMGRRLPVAAKTDS